MATNLQDVILNKIRKENVNVTVFLLNGFQIFGVIKSFDNYVIVVETDKKLQMIYKHAISTIIPAKHLNNLNIQSTGTDE